VQTIFGTAGGVDCDPGTDAHDIFSVEEIVDMQGLIIYGTTGWWVRVTFTGLDPSTEYTFVAAANRGNSDYTDRWTRYTIEGADAYINASSTGVLINSEDSVSICTGSNTVTGYIASWTGIQSGPDGEFTIKAEAHGSPYQTRKAYGFSAFKLEELSVGPVNEAPEVEAGSHRLTYLTPGDANVGMRMAATVTDDDLPTPDSLSMK